MSSGGQVLGGVVGAVAGFFLGGGPTGALYGAQIGMMAGGYLDPPKGPTVNGPRLDDLSVQTSTYGAVIPRVYGTVTVNGNVFWLENNRIKETVTKKKSGGKGGGSKTTTRTYTYSATFAVGLCKGPIVGVRRIWIGPDLIYDAGSSDPNTIAASNTAASGFRLYTGTDTQAADARMQATLGVPNTPAWRGLAYLVFYDLALARYANSLAGAQVRVEVIAPPLPTSPRILSTAACPGYYGSASEYAYADGQIKGIAFADIGSQYYIRQLAGPPAGCDSIVGSALSAGLTGGLYPALVRGNTDLVLGTLYSSYLAFFDLSGSEIGARISMATPFQTWAGGYSPIAWNGAASKLMMIGSTGAGASHYASASIGAGTWQALITYAAAPVKFEAIYGTSDGNTYATVNSSSQLYQIDWQFNILAGPWTYTASGPFLGRDGAYFYFASTTHNNISEQVFDGANYTLGDVHTLSVGASWGYEVYLGNRRWWLRGSTTADLVAFAETGVAQPQALSSVVSSECLQSGLLTSGDIDVSALVSSVRGYRIGSVGAIRAALEPLQAAWPFDVVQHGYQIRFVARGGASVVTIAAADLDARGAGQEPGVQITTSREMDSQLPRRVTVQHLDYDREYNTGTQYAERLNTAAINAQVLDLPIVLTATEAAGKAEMLLYLYWLERYDVAVTLPPTYNQLEPGDVVTLVTPEGNVSLRLTAVHYTSDGRVECKAKYASAAIYTPTAVGASPAVTGPSTITPVGASVYVLMDVPMLNSAQSGPSFLAAMTGALAGWRGGVLMQSTDAGSTWASLQDFGPPGSALGLATNSIGAVESRVIDSASLLNVTLTQGALYSVTQLAMLGGANHFAYGVDGRWEIIAAQTCTLVSGTSYVLKDLLRGRFGTEWAMSLHAVGDSLVLLDTTDVAATDVAAIAMSSGTIGLSYLYRGITVERDISTDSNRAFAYQGVNLKPLSPIALTGNIDPSINDWTLTWIRRTRDGGEWRDNVDASLGEASESYAIDVFADGSYTTVKRTITASTPSCAYSSADQVTDFGSNQTTLYLKIYQMSATVGRGYPLTQSITR